VHDKGSHVVRDSREDSFSLRRGCIKTGQIYLCKLWRNALSRLYN